MKKPTIKNILLCLIFGGLILISCNDVEYSGDEFNWSPDGTKLAYINIESKELLVADILNSTIFRTFKIDSIKREKEIIYAPDWSVDGRFLGYTKFDGKNFYINTVLFEENKFTKAGNFKINLLVEYSKKVHFPNWSPTANRILYSQAGNNRIQVIACAPDGNEKKILAEVKGKYLVADWSPDGQWIGYLIESAESEKTDGLWKVKADGSGRQQLLNSEEIDLFRWSPDGSKLALIERKIEKKDTTYVLSVLDSIGKNKQEIIRKKKAVTDVDWSPNGQMLSMLESDKKTRNIWVADMNSRETVRITYDNVMDYFGWKNMNQLYFTVEYPEEFVLFSGAENDKNEMSKIIRGIEDKNMLLIFDGYKFNKSGKNIYSFRQCPVNQASAFFKTSKPELLKAQYYLPMIQFADGSLEILAQSDIENLMAADEQVMNGNFDKALRHLKLYWNTNFDSTGLQHTFAVNSFSDEAAAEMDSIKLEKLLVGMHGGAWSKTIYVLRQLEQTKNAAWLSVQYSKLMMYYIKKNQNFDEFIWNVASTFGKFNAFDAGIAEFELIQQSVGGDSLFRSYACLAQALLATQQEKYDFVLEKINSSVELLPKTESELEPYNSLLFLYLTTYDKARYKKITAIFHKMLERFPGSKDAAKSFELLGDFYQKIGEKNLALTAYQSAAAKQENGQKIWRKIFDLKIN